MMETADDPTVSPSEKDVPKSDPAGDRVSVTLLTLQRLERIELRVEHLDHREDHRTARLEQRISDLHGAMAAESGALHGEIGAVHREIGAVRREISSVVRWSGGMILAAVVGAGVLVVTLLVQTR